MYHYAANNPIVYTDPDGRETDDTAEGKYIHSVITWNYTVAHKGEIVYGNKAMSTTMYKMDLVDKGLGKTDLGVRPDIWNITTNEMYEIKPATQGAGVAQAQLMEYIVLAAKYGLAGVKAGSSDAPGTSGSFFLPDSRTLVQYWSPAPGVILYSKTQLPKPEPNFNYNVDVNPYTAVLLFTLFILLTAGTGGAVPLPVF